mgnify:CR=1 FL=1
MEKKSFDIKKFLMKYVMYLFLILMCIVLTVASDKFLTVTNDNYQTDFYSVHCSNRHDNDHHQWKY